MANCESNPDDKNSSYQELEKTMFEIMREMELISTKDDYDPNNYQDDSDDNDGEEEYQSCIKIRGRPILPPLMTPERRMECLRWKREALEVEARLSEQRRLKILEAIKATREEEEEEKEQEQFGLEYRSADARVRSAFKNLITKLKTNLNPNFDQQQDTADDISPQFESLSSENTVVENTPQSLKNVEESNAADFDDLSPSDIRARKGSYTLDHPSPVLVAYLTRIGKAFPSMESPRPRSVLSARPPSKEAGKHLDNYLSELSQMPDPRNSDKSPFSPDPNEKSPTFSSDVSPIFNPPTPFANTPTISRSDATRLSKTTLESKDTKSLKSKIPIFSKIPTYHDSSDSDADGEPLSVASPMTTPSFPSIIQDSVSTQIIQTPSQRLSLNPSTSQAISNPVPSQLSLNPVSPQISSNPAGSSISRDFDVFSSAANDSLTPQFARTAITHHSNENSQEPNKGGQDSSNLPSFKLYSATEDRSSANPTSTISPDSSRVDPLLTHRTFVTTPSFASSLQNSVSIQIPKENEDRKKISVGKEELETAISTLALRQQAEIQRLLEVQEKQREQMKKMFEEQQKNLIREILQQVNVSTQQSRSSSDATLRPPSSSAALPLPTNPISSSPAASAGPSWSTIGRSSSPIIPTCASKARLPEDKLKELPPNFQVPPIVFTPQMKCHFDRLSALVKGHLVRRLLQTERVQRIISSMRDTMTIALQLHREARSFAQGKGNVSIQDIELHRRLLQQIFKDSQSIHNIFFNIPIAERMAILRQDREIRQERALRGEDPGPPKRISAVTRARMQQRKQIQAMLIKSEAAATKTRPKNVTRSQERPWRHKPSRDSPSKPRGVRSSIVGRVRRSLNLNENRTSGSSRTSPPSRLSKSTHRSTSAASSALSVIHNKPWK